MITKLYIDGWRLCVVYAKGRKWAHVLDCGTLRAHRLPLAEVEQAALVPGIKRKSLARKLERKRRQFNRLGVAHTPKAALRAIRQLRQED